MLDQLHNQAFSIMTMLKLALLAVVVAQASANCLPGDEVSGSRATLSFVG